MSEDLDDWNPMSDDFQSIAFNSYSSGQTAAHLNHNLVSAFGSEFCETRRPPKLYIEGFPSDLTENGLKNLLERIGCKVLSLKILRNKTRLSRHFSLVAFESSKEAQNAIQLIRSQRLFKLSVSFATTERDRHNRDVVIEREKQEFERLISRQTDMKPKIDIGNCSAINANSNGDTSLLSPNPSDSGSHESSHLEVLSPFAKSDKLLKILERAEDECSVCISNDPLAKEHLHFILSEQQVIDPNKLPALIEMLNVCLSCARKAIDLKLCSQCKGATYCNGICQSKDWSRHRLECKSASNDFLTFNSTLNSSKTFTQLNGSVAQNERSVESIKTVLKPNESTALKNVSSPTKTVTKTTPQIINTVRVSPKESTPIIAERINSCKPDGEGDGEGVKTIPKEVEKTNGSGDQIENERPKVVNRENVDKSSVHKITPIPTTVKTLIETEVLTDGEREVSVCFGRNPSDFYLQKSSAVEKMDVFVDELYNKMNEFPKLTEDELKTKGVLCGGVYSADGNCYRTQVVDKVSDDKYSLYFIDYGNTEEVQTKDIKRLPQIFFSCKAQAIHCSLDKINPKDKVWSRDAIALFSEIGESNDYSKVKIFEKTNEGIYKIDLFNKKGESIRQLFIDKGFGTFSDDLSEVDCSSKRTPISSPKKTPQKVTPIKADSPVVVRGSPKVMFDKTSIDKISANFVQSVPAFEEKSEVVLKSYINSMPNNSEISFMVTNIFNAEKLQYFGTVFVTEVQELIEGLIQIYTSNKQIVIPEVGDIVVVQGSDDEFYRSYVLTVEPKGAKVYMFDSGFIEDVSKTKIFKLDDKLKGMPVFGFMLLPDTQTGARLIELSQTNESTIEGTLIRKDDKLSIKTSGTDIDVMEYKAIIEFIMKCDEVFAEKVAKNGDPYLELPLRELPMEPIEVLALYQDPTDFKVFYVSNDANDCQILMNLCSKYSERFDDSIRVNPLPGNVYLVRSSDEGWYRALVNEVDGNKVSVKYIDFGNEEDIEMKYIMELSEELQVSTIKPLAIKCRVESTKLTDKELNGKIEKSTDGAMLLKMQALSIADGIYSVKVK